MRIRLAMIAVNTAGLGLMLGVNVFAQTQAANQPQELNYGPPATSYIAEAMKYPDAAAKPTPHLADGHPDLNGVWHHFFGNLVQKVGDNSFSLSFGGGGKPGGPPPPRPKNDPLPEYKAQYLAKVKYLNDNQVKEDHELHCMNPGVPRLGPPQQIVQTAKQVIFLYADSTGNQWRVISLEGRHSTDPDTESSDNGDSVAHWDGDTLVVDVTRLNDDNWLADNGLFHSKKLHVIERLRRVGDTIRYQMTAEDPEVLVKPWTISRVLTLQMDTLEAAAACVDNDAGHYVNSEHHDNAR